LPHFFILMVLAVYLISALSADDPDVEVLNSQEFQKAVEDEAFVTDLPEGDPGALTVRDEDQTVTGLLERDSGQPQQVKYSYPGHYDIAAVLNEADIPYTTNPQSTGVWTRMLVGVAPIFLVVLFFLFMMRWMQGGGGQSSELLKLGKSRAHDQGPAEGNLLGRRRCR
jgi:cell division protease FtsH